MGRTACTEPQCLYSRAIPLLPLWAVRPVQSLSACTRAHFTFTFYAVFQSAHAWYGQATFTSSVEQFNPANGMNCRNRNLLAVLLSQCRGHRPWPSIHARRLKLEAFLPTTIRGQCSYLVQSVEEAKEDTVHRIISDTCTVLSCQWRMTNLRNKSSLALSAGKNNPQCGQNPRTIR